MNTILNTLRATTSTLEKQEVLANLDEYDKKMFQAAYSQDKTYWLKFSDAEIDLAKVKAFCPEDAYVLSLLSSRELTGMAARSKVKNHCRGYGDLVKLICNKDLQCGVTATSVNKAWPNLINIFKVQLAKGVHVSLVKYPVVGQLKYDGVRVVITFDGEDVLFRTRNGKALHLPLLAGKVLDACKYQLGMHDSATGIMLDTEITLIGGTCEDRPKVAGMLNSAQHKASILESSLVVNIFDAMSLAEFNAGKCGDTYVDRLELARSVVRKLPSKHFKLAKCTVLRGPEEANKLFESYLAEGQEGVILKSLDHLYTFKRSKDWVKLKAIKTADLKCVGVDDGTGKYQGQVGALVCVGVVEGKAINVKVGTGLTDLERAIQFKDYLDKVVEVRYNSVIQDSVTGDWSLFLPRLAAIRWDKDD